MARRKMMMVGDLMYCVGRPRWQRHIRVGRLPSWNGCPVLRYVHTVAKRHLSNNLLPVYAMATEHNFGVYAIKALTCTHTHTCGGVRMLYVAWDACKLLC